MKKIEVKERLAELKLLHKSSASHLKPRLQMLILALHKDLHSKYSLATALGVDANSIHNWKKRYQKGGLQALLQDKRGGWKKPLVDAATDKAIAAIRSARTFPFSIFERKFRGRAIGNTFRKSGTHGPPSARKPELLTVSS